MIKSMLLYKVTWESSGNFLYNQLLNQ